jgi:hypothetical protein
LRPLKDTQTIVKGSSIIVAARARLGADSAADANKVVLTLHTVLALFVSFRGYPATQDGPAHLFGAHILGRLLANQGSPYQGVYTPNLHAAGNSLFTYWALWVERFATIEWAASLALFAALVGMPLSVMALSGALRSQGPSGSSVQPRLPKVAATSLACVLAYNYFSYRGFINFTLGVPCALAALAALVALGNERATIGHRILLALAAISFSFLAALAHPAATAFLLVCVVLAAVGRGLVRRLVACAMLALLLGLALASRISSDAPPRPVWVSPGVSLQWFVRALGITLTWAEVIPAALLLVFAVLGARRALRNPRAWLSEWTTAWPGVIAVGMALGYFVIPFEYGGAAGLNERIPLFSVLLLLPYVELTPRLARWFPAAFLVFAGYTAVERTRVDDLARSVRESRAAEVIPPGARAYLVALRVKMGAVSADLGRHLLADVARRHELVTGNVFANHPGHVLLATNAAPRVADLSAIQAFEHLNATEQAGALANPDSAIRRAFEQMQQEARAFHYLLVIAEPKLDAAFERYVTQPLGAQLSGPRADPLHVYVIPANPS